MSRLRNKVAVVTGAGGAIGSAIAGVFAVEGAAVLCLDLIAERAQSTAESIRASGGRAAWRGCDCSDAEAVKSALQYAVESFGHISTIVTTAANDDPAATVVELEESDWNKTFQVNLTSVFLISKFAIPRLAASGGGSIIIVASQLGRVAVPRRPAYVTSKGALIQLARALALDHAKDGIRVNTLSPGAIETVRITSRFGDLDAARRALIPLHPIGRLGRPSDIANGALFLASDESSFMTGSDLVMDGGYTCV